MKNHVDEIVNSFAAVSELYSVVVDINGHILVEPTGPATYLGEFHEIMLNPRYKKVYVWKHRSPAPAPPASVLYSFLIVVTSH